jgi:hypothetical protein
MLPNYFLLLVIAVTLAAWLGYISRRGLQQRALRRLAAEWRMQYSPGDRFRLSDRVAERFPVPGAADVRVVDLIYGNEQDCYRYIFSCEFTQGVVRLKHRRRRVATFAEPKNQTSGIPPAEWSPLVLAPEDLPPLEQYKRLHTAKTT